jgi:nucleoside-diphosphate-sugar epimerase
MRIALVGGAGFIGHHLALALTRAGDEVHVVDGLQVNNLLAFSAQPPDANGRDRYLGFLRERLDLLETAGVRLHVADARKRESAGAVLDEIRPHAIVHLAAVAHANRSNVDPHGAFEHSVRTLEHSLDYARRTGLEHLVYLSSSMVYGNFDTPTVTEEHPLAPLGIYGGMKLACEKMVTGYGHVFGLPYTIIRPSALYGQRCVSRRVGQVFIENALAGASLRVMGDGEEKLDFTYIDDLVSGIQLVLAEPAARNEVFNLTYGEARSMNDLVATLQEHFPDVDVVRVPRDELTPFRGTLSVDKARALLGYAPQYPIARGIPAYVEWYREALQRPADQLVAQA